MLKILWFEHLARLCVHELKENSCYSLIYLLDTKTKYQLINKLN